MKRTPSWSGATLLADRLRRLLGGQVTARAGRLPRHLARGLAALPAARSRPGAERHARSPAEQAARRTREFHLLFQAARALTSTLDLERVLQLVVAETPEVFPAADAGALFLYDPQAGALVPQAAFGVDFAAFRRVRLRPGEEVAGLAFQEGRPQTFAGQQLHALLVRLSPANRAALLAAGLDVDAEPSAAAVPLETNGIRLGSLLVYARSRPDAFDAESLQVLQALADLMAVAVQNARLFAERQQQHAQRRRLLERLIWTQEEERKRIARDLHDELGQSLTALRLALESVRAVILADLDEAHRRLDEARDLTGAMLADLRRLMLNLRPSMLDDLGLRSALRWYVQAHLEPAGLKVQLDVDLKDAARLPPPVETGLYRIVQEAGTNILRHAQATTVRIGLTRQAERIRMVIEDDGRGFDPARVRPTGPAGLGLLGMTERALSLGGTLWIESRPGAGTRVHVELPCASPEAPA